MDCTQIISQGQQNARRDSTFRREERGAIQHLKCQGYTNRAIARETRLLAVYRRQTNCDAAHRLVRAIRAGTPGYSARRWRGRLQGQQECILSGSTIGYCRCAHFLHWASQRKFKEHKWSLDACVGYARLHGLFPADEMVCTRTLYNEVWAGNLDLSVTELPEAHETQAAQGFQAP